MSKKLKYPFELDGHIIATVKEIKEIFIKREEQISGQLNGIYSTEQRSTGIGGSGLNLILGEEEI